MKIKMFFSCCFLGALIAISLLTGCASLSKASINGNLDQVKQLLHDGENINEYDRWGWTPLLWAIYYDYPGIVNFLLENGANPNATTHARYGNIEIGSTPLIIASYYGYTEIVLRLLKYNADKSVVNNRGETAFTLAMQGGFTEVAKLLEQ